MSLFHHHPSRRKFLKKSFSFLGCAGLFSHPAAAEPHYHHDHEPPAAPTPPMTAKPERETSSKEGGEPFRVFDAHLHCPSEAADVWQWHPITRTFEDFVRYLDSTGVERGIINSVRCQKAKTAEEFIEGNREVARYVDKYKGRFVGACVVNPLFIDESLKEIEYCRKELGFVWVGELCNYMPPFEYTIKEFELLVEQVVKLNMVLDVHTQLEEMDYIIRKFPEATIVFPHFGGGPDPIYQRIALVAEHKNCYLDTSGSGQERMGMLEHAVQTIGPDRVLFGSDFTINCPATVLGRIRHALIPEEQKRQILSSNLERLIAKAQA